MKKLTIILALSLMTIFLIVQSAGAVPAAPSHTCQITATVIKLDRLRTDIEGSGQPPRKDLIITMLL